MSLTRTCAVDPPVLMNPPKLQRVLYNLVSHALRHTPADGTVALHAEHDGEVVRVEGTATQDLLHAFE
jgi:two-component system sensor histidine kinase BaeS